MKLTLGELKCLINESLNGGIHLVRVGGLSPVKQSKESAPERYGVWAFVYPYIEPYLLGGTNPEGLYKKGDHERENTRAHQMKREGFKHFNHKGVLYTRIAIPGVKEVDGWFKTDGITLNDYMGKHYAQTWAALRKPKSWQLEDPNFVQKPNQKPSYPFGANPWQIYSKDEFEVFVPNPDETNPNKQRRLNDKGHRNDLDFDNDSF